VKEENVLEYDIATKEPSVVLVPKLIPVIVKGMPPEEKYVVGEIVLTVGTMQVEI